MGNPILKAELNLQDGLLRGVIEFQPGLNIISGENGTLKTKALQALKSGQWVQHENKHASCRRQAISPKRNAQRRAFAQIFEQSRRSNLKLDTLINERNINDAQFEDYPSLGDLFYVVYEDLCKDGGIQIERMNQATADFNTVIKRIFPHYELLAQWNESTGAPDIQLLKRGSIRVPLEGLSLGEQEILSLAAYIYSSRERYDVFLIDEPEVHLNWHLEEKLFEFFDDYCDDYGRQMIVVTHSRVVFSRRFFPKSQFFYWNEHGRVEVADDVTEDQRKRIAGDAIEIIQLGNVSKPTIFVEDNRHAVVVEELSSLIGIDVGVTVCGNKSNVRALYRLAKREPGWNQACFLEDGDNEGTPHPDDRAFVHLSKYCIENYLLDPGLIASIRSVSEAQVKSWILESVLENKDKIFKRNKFFEFLLDHLKEEHLTEENLSKLDAAEIMDTLLSKIGMDFTDYVRQYLQKCSETGRLRNVLPVELLEVLENSRPTSDVTSK